MQSKSGPWYWKARAGYYATLDGRRIRLARGTEHDPEVRATAHARFAELRKSLQQRGVLPLDPGEAYSVATLGKLFLASRRDRAENTIKNYEMVVRLFGKDHGTLAAEDITIGHVNGWIAANHWTPGTVHGHLTVIKTWWKWAFEEAHIPSNPLAKLKRPPASIREKIPTKREADHFLACLKPRELQDVLIVIYATGCRPCEVYALEASNIDFAQRRWSRPGKSTSRTGRPRIVYFPEWVSPLLRDLAARHREGPIFRTATGRPWTGTAVSKEVARLRVPQRIPAHVTPVTLRHVFATDALEMGKTSDQVAALLGHTSVAQVDKTYGRLRERPDVLREAVDSLRPAPALRDASGREADPGEPSPPSRPS